MLRVVVSDKEFGNRWYRRIDSQISITGPVMLGMFNIMERFGLTSPSASPANETMTGLNMHRMTEAMKFAFGARTEISDPDVAFMDEKRKERVQGFTRGEWADQIVQEITDVSEERAYGPGLSLIITLDIIEQDAHCCLLSPRVRCSD
jgi:gamma-glutamyltranspeptidase/glutathione hydrolase/leukotriene-C4 hydrolase